VTGAHAEPGSPTPLLDVLGDARTAGFLGPGPLDAQVRHAEGFVTVARALAGEGSEQPSLVDLGAGGGLPGLVVAWRWPQVDLVLLEAAARRAAFLRRAVERLDLAARVSVLEERAEVCGRLEGLRGTFDGILARSFGRPAVVAECAAPLLRVGGWLVVSEPPEDPHLEAAGPRWPPEGLRQFGLESTGSARAGFEFHTLRQADACPERFPRRNGVPAKRPLF
jgi:16S rRNA (guanine527-N7)-methyltransferase